MWHSVISNAVIFIAVSVFVTTVLDMFLSSKQKTWIEDHLIRLWHFLSEAKQYSLIGWLRHRCGVITWSAVLLATALTGWMFRSALMPLPQVSALIPALVIFGLGLWFGRKVVRVTLNATSLPWAVSRASIFLIIALAPFTIFAAIVWLFEPAFRSMATSFATSIATNQGDLGSALFALAYVWTYVLSVQWTALALIFWISVAVPLSAIYALTVFTFILEFIVRRLAEYPKGPVLAGSVLLGAVGALLKALLS